MTQTVRLRLQPDSPPLEVRMETLVAEAVHGELLSAESTWLYDRHRWRPIRELTDAPWRAAMLESVDRFLRAGQAHEAGQMAHRVLRYCDSPACADGQRASFYLGVLKASAGEWSAAADLFRPVAAGNTACRAAAHNNLAVALATLGDPVGAVEHVLAAQSDPRMLTAVLTQRVLSQAMLRARAADIPARPTWKELHSRAGEKLEQLDPHELRRAADPAQPFPSIHVLCVLHAQQCPADLAARLTTVPTGAAAARQLSARAAAALRSGQCELAMRLAEGAQRLNPAAAEEIRPILASAQLRLEEQRRLRFAGDYAHHVCAFFESLEQMTLDTIDAPRESLALLRPFFKSPAGLESLHRQRVGELIEDALRETQDPQRRRRLLELRAQTGSADVATVCREAARHIGSQAAWRQFRQAVLAGDSQLAAAALRQLDAVSADVPEDVLRSGVLP